MTDRKVMFPFQLSRQDYDRLKRIARKEEVPAAQIIRKALRRELQLREKCNGGSEAQLG
jgi:hypothetical protein